MNLNRVPIKEKMLLLKRLLAVNPSCLGDGEKVFKEILLNDSAVRAQLYHFLVEWDKGNINLIG